ncbi:MAG: squalene--hopene cyclase, partial [Alicyclobacillus sp.]|nr:squalene--hopene cyclase [Alicyclobacillus sp.]
MSLQLSETLVPDETIEAGVSHLLSLQHPEGYWWGLLASNVCMEAEYVLLCHCLGRRQPDRERQIQRYLFSQQREDGTWAIFPGGPGDLNATVEAYQALKLIGVPASDPRMQKAGEFIRSQGGVEATRVFTRLWLALVGQYPWNKLPVVPPEMMFLPKWCPLNIYDFASWARATVVPISIVMSRRPVFPLPEGAGIGELFASSAFCAPPPKGGEHGLFRALDRILQFYQQLSFHPGRAAAEQKALEWIIRRQEGDGSWGGIQPPWFYSLLALYVTGHANHPAFQKGWEGLEAYGVETADGGWWFQACVSPVWDTALSVLALRAAGLAPDHPALVRAGEWLCDRQVFADGDWKVRRPRLEPGGWAFEFDNVNYPDIDDTAVVVLALNGLRLPDEARRRRALTAGFRWLVGLQSQNGGWGAYDADNTRELVNRIPFCDFGEVIDPPSEDVTGHVLECFGSFGYDDAWPVVRRGVDYLKRMQKPDGSWFGRWGVNYIYGTGAVVPALAAVGIDMREPWVQRALDWLEAHQNEDGGWGEDCRSYEDERFAGRGASTPSQTGWALMALVAGGRAHGEAARRGVAYLRNTQRPDGGWDEPYYTGTGFPKDFY